MNINIRVTSGIILSGLVILAGIVIFGYILVYRTIPPKSGSLEFFELNESVNLYTDANGIAYIEARGEDDALRALGFVHARERLFQMEIMRRIAAGEVSEIVGSVTVPVDAMFKTIGLARIVKRDYPKLSETTRHSLKVYTEGVNLLIKEYGSRFAPELNLMTQDIKPWKPEDSFLVSKFVGWVLNLSWWTDAAYIDLANKLGKDAVQEIIPQFDENYPLIINDKKLTNATPAMDMIRVDKFFREFFGIEGTQVGSNNWVISPAKSASGKAMLANDPHLAVTHPNIWFAVVINSPELTSAGFSIPGAPGIVIGKNNSLAWGYTNVMADDCDFYTEQQDSSGNKYLLDGEWHEFTVYEEKIKVKDSTDVDLEVKATHRGPVINNVRPNVLLHGQPLDSTLISMRWTGYEFSDEIGAILAVNKSQDKNEFVKAVEGFKLPGQNFLFADSSGNIGYICAARLPIRGTNTPSYIYDGRYSSSDWKGFVPFTEMPIMMNPSENFVASANNKVVKKFKYHISNIWEPTSRIERIRQYLSQDTLFGFNDFSNMQNDIKSIYASHIVPGILNAFNNVEVKDQNLDTALELLRQWDFRMDAASQTPAIFSVFKMKMLQNLFLDEMGKEYFNEYAFLTNIPHRILEEYFIGRESSWIDDKSTPEWETFDDVVRKSMVDAISWLEKKYGKNPAMWQWGKMHKLSFQHPFSRAAGFLSGILDIGPFEVSGDGTTLSNTEFSFVEPYNTKVIASMRMIYDFAEPEILKIALPTGQSGHFLDEHYSDLAEGWLNGEYISVFTDIHNFENNNYELFVLKKPN